MYDTYDNPITTDNLFDISQIDSYILGPTDKPASETIQKILSIVAVPGTGTYYLRYTVLISGIYKIYTRVGKSQIATYPLEIESVSNKASAGHSKILEYPLATSIAGKIITFTLYILGTFCR